MKKYSFAEMSQTKNERTLSPVVDYKRIMIINGFVSKSAPKYVFFIYYIYALSLRQRAKYKLAFICITL